MAPGALKGPLPWAHAHGGMCAIGLVVPLSTNWIPAVKINRKPGEGTRPQGRAPDLRAGAYGRARRFRCWLLWVLRPMGAAIVAGRANQWDACWDDLGVLAPLSLRE